MKNLLCRTKSGRRKGSLGLVLDSDAADEAASTNGAAAAPAPADAVEDANHATAGPAPAVVDDATAGPAPVDGGDGAAPDDDGSESELADDDGISESSTAWEKERRTALSRTSSAHLAEAVRRGDDLEAKLRTARGELRQERARLAALSTRLGAVEATLRLERESIRPEREKLVAMAMDAVDRATRLNDACRALHATNAALRGELDGYQRREAGSTVGLRRSISGRPL